MTIPLNELEPRGIYKLWARNLILGVWTGDQWIGIREKFGSLFLDSCEVPGDDTTPGSARAYERIGVLPNGIEMRTQVEPFCETCRTPVYWIPSKPEGPSFGTWVHRVYSAWCDKPRPVAPMYQPLFDYLTEIGGTP